MKNALFLFLGWAVLAFSARGADPWPSSVVRFLPDRAWTSGDEVTVRVTPPDVPESVGFTLYTVCRDRTAGIVGRRLPFEFEGMPTKLKRESQDGNVWSATFKIPFEERARTVAAKDLVVDLLRYGSDTHYDGTDSFVCPHPVAIKAGDVPAAKTNLRVYDFGPDDSAVYPGSRLVGKTVAPEEFAWIQKPLRWERSRILQLDALVHDWVATEANRPIAFKLKVPNGRWHIAATFGAIGKMCWENAPYLPVDVRFDVQGKTVYTKVGDEAAAFAYRDHEADPDEDIYDVYIKPVICDFETTAEVANGELSLGLLTTREKKRATIDSLAIWPEGDAEAAARYARILARRKTSFSEAIKPVPPTARYGIMSLGEYRARGAAARVSAPVAAAMDNPFDWVLMDGEPPATQPELTVAAACGERVCGGILFRSDVDAKAVVVRVAGLPDGISVSPYKIMNFWHCYGVSRTHWIAPNHLMPGPRDVRKGYNYGWMIRFGVPTSAVPGDYAGTVSVVTHARTFEIPLRLRVYPFELPELADYRIGVMGTGEGTEDYFRFARDELENTTIHIANSRNENSKFVRDAAGHVVACAKVGGVTPEELDLRFKRYRAAGFPYRAPYCGPHPNMDIRGKGEIKDMDGLKAWTDEWKEAIRLQYATLLAIARSNGCETVTLDMGGELGSDGRAPEPGVVAEQARYMRFVKELFPEILLSHRCNSIGETENLYGPLDVVGVRGRPSWDFADRVGGYSKIKPTYVYSVGGRFQNGVGGWYHGATGSFREWIAFNHSLEFNDFVCQGACGCAMHFEAMPAPKAEGSYGITQRGEAFRSGINDVKYLKVLETAIAEARRDPARRLVVAEAVNFLGFVRAAAGNAQIYYDFCSYGGPFRQDGGNDWPYLRLDYMRELCARHVAALRTGRSAGHRFRKMPKRGDALLMLDDGPLNRTRGGVLGGAFALTSSQKGVAEVVLAGNGVRRVLKTEPQHGRIRQLYWKSDASFRFFSFDTSDLGEGIYSLTLTLNGKPIETTTFDLVDF